MRSLRSGGRALRSCIMGVTLLLPSLPAAAATLSGFVRSAEDGEALSYANVSLRGTRLGDVTNDKGFYSLTDVPAGTYTVSFSYLGFASQTRSVTLAEDGAVTLTVELVAQAIEVKGVEVEAEANPRLAPSRLTIRTKELGAVPSIGGRRSLPRGAGPARREHALRLLERPLRARRQPGSEPDPARRHRRVQPEPPLRLLQHLQRRRGEDGRSPEVGVPGALRRAALVAARRPQPRREPQGIRGRRPGRASSPPASPWKGRGRAAPGWSRDGTPTSSRWPGPPRSICRTTSTTCTASSTSTRGANDRTTLSDYPAAATSSTGTKARLDLVLDWGNDTWSAQWTHIFNPRLFSHFLLGAQPLPLRRDVRLPGLRLPEPRTEIDDVSLKGSLSFDPVRRPRRGFRLRELKSLDFTSGGDVGESDRLHLPVQRRLRRPLRCRTRGSVSRTSGSVQAGAARSTTTPRATTSGLGPAAVAFERPLNEMSSAARRLRPLLASS